MGSGRKSQCDAKPLQFMKCLFQSLLTALERVHIIHAAPYMILAQLEGWELSLDKEYCKIEIIYMEFFPLR